MIKRTITFIIIVIASLFLPLLFNPANDLIVWFTGTEFAQKWSDVFQYLAIDKTTYFAILSIEATALVAYAIYRMQRRAEKERETKFRVPVTSRNYQGVQDFVEEILIATVDVIGYEFYYWEQVPDTEKSYNEYDELEITKKAKIDFLEQVVRNMKAKL